jgi:hypothetical protein
MTLIEGPIHELPNVGLSGQYSNIELDLAELSLVTKKMVIFCHDQVGPPVGMLWGAEGS